MHNAIDRSKSVAVTEIVHRIYMVGPEVSPKNNDNITMLCWTENIIEKERISICMLKLKI